MKIVIATPLYPPHIGGPAKYAHALAQEFAKEGHEVSVITYSAIERALPLGLRHAAYLLRLLPRAYSAHTLLALDTWSVGLPALLAARLVGAKLLVRIGGDFLWESYVERTRTLIKLSEFYRVRPELSRKERFIQKGTRWLLRRADALLFTTTWQKELWQPVYGFALERAHVVENYYPKVTPALPPRAKVFVAAGRAIALKNVALLRKVFTRVQATHPEITLDERALPAAEHRQRLADCYAVVVSSISEVNPNSAIEALEVAKPFVAPKDSGIYSRLKDLGLFVDTQDEVALERALNELLDEVRYADLQARIERFTYTHSWAEMAQEIAAIAHRI